MHTHIFQHLAAHKVVHGSYSRHRGSSGWPYDSLNVGLHVGDAQECVCENRERIKQHLGIERLISAKQVHGCEILSVTKRPAEDAEHPGYDALITDLPGVALMIQQADCQAIMLHDPINKAVANIHSGWRGSVQNIIGKTVRAMRHEYGSQPRELLAAISPSLGPCCGEFVDYRDELPEPFHSYQVRPHYFDFWAISRDQLIESGVRRDHIEIAGVCTVCDPNYFSYRRDGVTGRFASVIALPKTS